MNRLLSPFLVLLTLAACGSKESAAPEEQLRSDMPARTVSYYVAHNAELKEMDAICGKWRASQRPIASWPSVVFQNCNNVGGAKQSLANRAENDKLLNAGK